MSATRNRIPVPVGSSFRKWTVLGFAGMRNQGQLWAVRCECGTTKTIAATILRRGFSSSCGCAKGEFVSQANTRHGLHKSAIYTSWHAMRQRCNNPKAIGFHNYGGRGIRVCKEWDESFYTFLSDMGSTHRDGLTLDRIDNNRDYEPGNCRWATRAMQAKNRRDNVWIETSRGLMLMSEAAAIAGIDWSAMQRRLKLGATGEAIFLPPYSTKSRNGDHRRITKEHKQ